MELDFFPLTQRVSPLYFFCILVCKSTSENILFLLFEPTLASYTLHTDLYFLIFCMHPDPLHIYHPVVSIHIRASGTGQHSRPTEWESCSVKTGFSSLMASCSDTCFGASFFSGLCIQNKFSVYSVFDRISKTKAISKD